MSSKSFIAGLVVGAVALAIVGFSFFDWKLDSKAQAMADDAAHAAVKEALVPVCMAQFRADPRASAHMAALKAEKYSHPRVEYIRNGGWATLPGQSEPASGLANACVKALLSEAQ